MSWTLRQAIGNNAFDCADEVPGLGFRNDLGNSSGARGLGKSRHIQHCKQDQGCFRIERGHRAGCFEAIHVGHGEVDQYQVGSQLIEFCDTGTTGFRFAADGPFTRVNDRTKDATRGLGIVDDENAQFHRGEFKEWGVALEYQLSLMHG
jgi:hypothetical protein